jgi:hypothetical protein
MNRLLVCLIVSALCLVGWTAHAELTRSTPAPQTWDYEVFEDYASILTITKLNKRGAQGWELVSVVCPRGTEIPCLYYMKRAR